MNLMKKILTIICIPCKNIWLTLKYKKSLLRIGFFCILQKCSFGYSNSIYHFVKLTEVDLGDFTYIANGTKITKTKIGKFCAIGPNVLCGLGKHPSRNFISIHPIFYSLAKQAQQTFVKKSLFEEYQQINIGHDVWIGANAIILDGTKIGNGAIIGAGSVVTKDVPPYAIVAGNPARLIRFRFDTEQIQLIENSKWWDKETAWLQQHAESFQSFDHFKKKITTI